MRRSPPEAPTPNGAGRFAHYEHGSIYYSPGTGAHEVHGAIRDKWALLGWEQSALGFPTSDESDGAGGGRFNHFQGGSIYFTAATGAHEVRGAIHKRWRRTGWERGPLGYPITDEGQALGRGRFNHFERGSIYWTPETGAHEVHGAIHAHWRASGYERGPLGFPTTDETAVPGSQARWNRFEHGQIYWTREHGARMEPAEKPSRRPWLFILCKHADVTTEPKSASELWNLFTEDGEGTQGLYDYFRDVTYGGVSLEGSVVIGWYTLPHTLATDIAWRDTMPASQSRARRIDAGIRAAGAGIDFTQFDGICVILNGVVDSGSLGRQPRTINGVTNTYGLVVLDPNGWNPTVAAHELAHGLGLPHTFSDTTPPTEYGDPWDLMSATNVHSYPASRYGTSGPALCAPYRMSLDSMPADRVYVAGVNGQPTEHVTVAALDNPHLPLPLVVKVPAPVSPGQPGRYFTVETRLKVGWDRGIPANVVLIHDVRGNIATLIQSGSGPEFGPGETFVDAASGVSIRVSPNAAPVGTAVIAVSR